MVILWTFGHQESEENLLLFFNYLYSKGVTVFTLDIHGILRYKGVKFIFKVPKTPRYNNNFEFNKFKLKWIPIIDSGYESHRPASSETKYNELENQATFLLNLIEPDIVVIWNPLAPNFGVLGDISKSKSISCIYSERGVVPNTVILDPNGLWKKAEYSISKHAVNIKKDVHIIEKSWDLLSGMEKGVTPNNELEGVEFKKIQDFFTVHLSKKLVVIIGSPRHEHSIGKESFESGESGLPICADYNEMIEFLLNENKDCVFIFKPHPHSKGLVLPISDRLLETNIDAVWLINQCDYVILNGSKLEITAFLLNKPIILAGNGLIWGSGVSSDCTNIQYVSNILKLEASDLLFVEHRNSFVGKFYKYVTNDLYFYTVKDRIDEVDLEQNFQKFAGLMELIFGILKEKSTKKLWVIHSKLWIIGIRIMALNKLKNLRWRLSKIKSRVFEKWDDFVLRILFVSKFYNKSVALIGNSAALSESILGSKIDSFDIVVRFNVALTKDREVAVGTRTDLRFIGLTVSDKWLNKIKDIPPQDRIWSFSKNLNYYVKESRRVKYIPTYYQKIIISRFNEKFKHLVTLPLVSNPPRSGIIFLLLLLLFGGSKSITLFGFSIENEESLKSAYQKGEIKHENTEEFFKAHCDPNIEIVILKLLADRNLINIF